MPYAKKVKKILFYQILTFHFTPPQQRRNSFLNESLIKKYFLKGPFGPTWKCFARIFYLYFFEDLAMG
jgi:hypothetical protein